jgi:hypothetical protein
MHVHIKIFAPTSTHTRSLQDSRLRNHYPDYCMSSFIVACILMHMFLLFMPVIRLFRFMQFNHGFMDHVLPSRIPSFLPCMLITSRRFTSIRAIQSYITHHIVEVNHAHSFFPFCIPSSFSRSFLLVSRGALTSHHVRS